MNDRMGQVWDVAAHRHDPASRNAMHVYLVIDVGVREDRYKRWLHRAFNLGTGEMTDLQEVDGMEWETLNACARYG